MRDWGAVVRSMLRAAIVAFAFAAIPFAKPDVPRNVLVEPDKRFEALRRELEARVAKQEFVSLSIGVLQAGRIVWAESFGWADREAGVPATAETRYGLASLGKSITATAMMTLVERKRVRLDDDVRRHLGPAFLSRYVDGEPTIRQLLNMTSGIPHGAMTYEQVAAPSEQDALSRRAIVVFKPGAVFHYSNFSYAVADRVIEKAAAGSFGDYLAQSVFAPLDMRQASLSEPAGQTRAAGRYDGEGKRIAPIESLPRNSRGMNASLSDLLKYTAFNLNTLQPGQKRILPAAALNALHYARGDAPGSHVALGWGSIDLPGGQRWLVTNGQDLGVQSIVTLLPSAKAGVAILANTTGGQVDEIAIRTADLVAPGFAAAALAAIERLEAASSAFRAGPEWSGIWKGQVKAAGRDIPVVTVFQEDGQIRIALDGQYPTLLDEARVTKDMLTGAFLGKLPLEEATDRYHRIELAEGGRQSGRLCACKLPQ
jgi:CubicO group peptidase (beta-lactamase class C family)